jgi:hypothetical protein
LRADPNSLLTAERKTRNSAIGLLLRSGNPRHVVGFYGASI